MQRLMLSQLSNMVKWTTTTVVRKVTKFGYVSVVVPLKATKVVKAVAKCGNAPAGSTMGWWR